MVHFGPHKKKKPSRGVPEKLVGLRRKHYSLHLKIHEIFHIWKKTYNKLLCTCVQNFAPQLWHLLCSSRFELFREVMVHSQQLGGAAINSNEEHCSSHASVLVRSLIQTLFLPSEPH